MYDHELIEDLFNPKKKVRLVKQNHDKNNQFNRVTTMGSHLDGLDNSVIMEVSLRKNRFTNNRDTSPDLYTEGSISPKKR